MKKFLVVLLMVVLMVMPAYAGTKEKLEEALEKVFEEQEFNDYTIKSEGTDEVIVVYTTCKNSKTGYKENSEIMINKNINKVLIHCIGYLDNSIVMVKGECDYNEDLFEADNFVSEIARRGKSEFKVVKK